MSLKDLKASFALPSAPCEVEPGQEKPENEPGDDGLYPRSLHILDFALTNLFCAGYAIPHTDKVRVLHDTAERMTYEELEGYEAAEAEALDGKTISRAHALPNPADGFFFEFLGTEDWSPCQISLYLCDHTGESVELGEAPDAMQEAYKEFLHDLSMATTHVEGVRVKMDEGTIEVGSPLALYKVITDLIIARNEAADEAAEEMKKDLDAPDFPMELRDIDLPQMGWESYSGKGQDLDLSERTFALVGADFLDDEDTQEYALQNVPPRAYHSKRDLYLALCDVKARLEVYAPMVRLDEMEAIIRQETHREKTYAPNPLLNLH